jgi:hypothetical protein
LQKSRVNIAINDHPLGGHSAASVTACCSAIPSKARSGKASIMNFRKLKALPVLFNYFFYSFAKSKMVKPKRLGISEEGFLLI